MDVMSAAVLPGSRFTIEAPRRLFTAPIRPRLAPQRGPSGPNDVAPDGQRFLLARLGGPELQAPIQVVLNWTAAFSPR